MSLGGAVPRAGKNPIRRPDSDPDPDPDLWIPGNPPPLGFVRGRLYMRPRTGLGYRISSASFLHVFVNRDRIRDLRAPQVLS